MSIYRVMFYIAYPVYADDEEGGFQAAEELLIDELRKKGVSPIYAVRELLGHTVEDLGETEDIRTVEDAKTVKKMLKERNKKK